MNRIATKIAILAVHEKTTGPENPVVTVFLLVDLKGFEPLAS